MEFKLAVDWVSKLARASVYRQRHPPEWIFRFTFDNDMGKKWENNGIRFFVFPVGRVSNRSAP